MGRICPPLFGDKSKDTLEAELKKVRSKMRACEENLAKLKEDEQELIKAIASK